MQGSHQENKEQLIKSTFLDDVAEIWEATKKLETYDDSQAQVFSVDAKMDFFTSLIGMRGTRYAKNAFSRENSEVLRRLILEICEHLIQNDMDDQRKRRIVRRLTFKSLRSYFVKLFNEFRAKFQGMYFTQSHSFLKYGFKVYLLLENTEDALRELSLVDTNTVPADDGLSNAFAEAYRFFESNTGSIWVSYGSSSTS